MLDTVTATEWGIAFCIPSPAGSPVMLNVVRTDLNAPNLWGGVGQTIRHPEHDGLVFDSRDECERYCVEVGLLKEYPDERIMA
jgi:hypothetical protein